MSSHRSVSDRHNGKFVRFMGKCHETLLKVILRSVGLTTKDMKWEMLEKENLILRNRYCCFVNIYDIFKHFLVV